MRARLIFRTLAMLTGVGFVWACALSPAIFTSGVRLSPAASGSAGSTPNWTRTRLTGLVAAPASAFSQARLRTLQQAGANGAAGALLFLCDAWGRPLLGLPVAKADASGRFVLEGVPVGFSFVLTARLNDGRSGLLLRTLVRPGTGMGNTLVSGATTLVVGHLLLNHKHTLLGIHSPATFEAAVAQVQGLDETKVSITWGLVASYEQVMVSLKRQNSALATSIDELRQSLERPSDADAQWFTRWLAPEPGASLSPDLAVLASSTPNPPAATPSATPTPAAATTPSQTPGGTVAPSVTPMPSTKATVKPTPSVIPTPTPTPMPTATTPPTPTPTPASNV